MTRAAARLAAALSLSLVLCQCSSSKPAASSSAQAVLERDVATVTAAVDRHDSAGAAQALASLHSDLTRLEGSGQVTSAYAASVLQSAGQVQTDLALITTTTTTTTTTLPPVTAPPHGHHDGGGDQGPGPGPGPGPGGKG